MGIMEAERHPLTLLMEELFISSHLTPAITSCLLRGVDSYFKANTIAISDNIPALTEQLYSIGDNEMYTIVSFCNQQGYQAVLLPQTTHFIRHSSQEAVKYIRESENYQKEQIAEEIGKINRLMKAALYILRDSTRTSRQAIGLSNKTIDFPDFETLERFYQCGRKTQYLSQDDAMTNLSKDNRVYQCPHCTYYHQGRTALQNAPTIPHEIKLGRYKTAWRRYHKI